jgi:hypothetical protein
VGKRHASLAEVLATGGETGCLALAADWASSPLGPPESWPRSLRTVLGVVYSSRLPMLVGWGEDLVQVYNDGFLPIMGRDKHPRALGRPWQENWPEIWEFVGPMLHGVLEHGESTRSDDQRLLIERSGYLEEAYFTFSFSPVWDESDSPGGVFCAAIETTERVLGERRLGTLGRLGEQGAQARNVEQALAGVTEALAANPDDLAFALLYLLSEDGTRAVLSGSTGVGAGSPGAPETVVLDDSAAG